VYQLYHKIKCQGLSDLGILCKWKRSYGLSFVNFTNHKIITTKHGEYLTVITKDYDMINLNIDKNIENEVLKWSQQELN
jgi:hypothetical protein